jgi:hypothetical protein
MKMNLLSISSLAILSLLTLVDEVTAQFAVDVVSYDSGLTPAAGYTMPAAALGSPERFTGEGVFPSIVSPFSPPFLNSEIVSIGEGGWLTLRLSHYAIPQAGDPEIGVFTNVGLIETNFPNGQAGSPPGTFGVDSAVVELSENGQTWISLNEITFDIPTNGYTDLTNPFSFVPGSSPSDFQQPFTGTLSDFGGLRYSDAGAPDILELLAGSGGGKWFDLSMSGLPQVGFIRFSVPNDLDSGTSLNFELDAVVISLAAIGDRTVPEPTTIALLWVAFAFGDFILARRRRNTE